MSNRIPFSLILLILTSSALFGAKTYPEKDWKPKPDPVASPDAIPGGKVSYWGSQYPKSFNYFLDQNVISSAVFAMMFEQLLTINPDNLEYEPYLAKRWTISDDQLTFTFTLDKNARWSDGRPIIADDVIWTYNAIMKPENLTGQHKVGLDVFDEVKKLDKYTVRFHAKKNHWRNMVSLATFQVLPSHYWKDLDFNKVNFEFPVISGQYKIHEVKEGKYLRMKKREDWWNKDDLRAKNTNNFDIIEYRFYPDQEMAFEAFKNGEIDVYFVYTSHRWMRQTDSEAFRKNWIQKQIVYNHEPSSFQGFAINMRLEKFKDIRVRKALAHLLDRPRMNNDLMYNAYKLHRSVVEDLYDKEHPCKNEYFDFDVDKARKLFSEAGWQVNKQTGKLEKDGQPFIIHFLTRDPSSDKFLVIYKEALNQVGVDLEIVRKDWAAWMKDIDEYNFEMTWAAWGGTIWRDPENMWSSKQADIPTGVNITGFKNTQVDELIEKQKTIFDIQERRGILREIDSIVYNEVPYILLWYIDYKRIVNWNKFGKPDTVLSRFGGDTSSLSYWWYDPDSNAALLDAQNSAKPLPEIPYEIHFDEEYIGE